MSALFEDVFRAMLVGTDVASTRVFFMRAPQVPAEQAKTPYLVFLPVGPAPYHSMNGALKLLSREYQVSIFDPSQSRATGIADTLRVKLDGVSGVYADVRFGHLLYRSQTCTYELTTNLYHVIVTFRILYELLESFQRSTFPHRKPNASERRPT